MKMLFLVRHAKSSWKDSSLPDFKRPLNKRGKRDAPFMGEKLKGQGILPDLLLSSPAERAKKTAKAIARKTGYPQNTIVFNKEIYEADVTGLLSLLRQQSNACTSVMLVGHNPELTMFSNLLCNGSIENIPTTGISCIRFAARTWAEVAAGSGTQSFFDYPKRYKQA